MKTRLSIIIIIVIGIAVAGTLSIVTESYLNANSTCENLGGKLIDYNTCQFVRPVDTPICDPGPVLEDGYCYKNGLKIVASDFGG